MKKYIIYFILLLPLLHFGQVTTDYCRDVHPDAVLWYADFDKDGFINPLQVKCAITRPSGYNYHGAIDCNDRNADIKGMTTWYLDNDGDGHGQIDKTKQSCNQPVGYGPYRGDCNDDDKTVYEIKTYYRDVDKDGYGNSNISKRSCGKPEGFVEDKGDCDDDNPEIHPGIAEGCAIDGIDNNCNGVVDENIPPTPTLASITKECGVTKIMKKPHHLQYKWYWQSSATGTDTTNEERILARTSGTVHYLRSLDTRNGCWSRPLTINYTVDAIPSTPPLPTVQKNCGNTVLTREEPSNGVTWYWQNSVLGTDTTNSAQTMTHTQDGVVYLRGRNDASGCWGYSVKVGFSVIQPQIWYADFDRDGFGDPANSITDCIPPADYVLNNDDRCPQEYGEIKGCVYSPYDAVEFSNENYIFTQLYQEPMNSPEEIRYNKDVIESITYFDGIGRPMQQSEIRASPNEKDITTHIVYDGYGRESKKYLPFEYAKGPGSYQPVDVNQQISKYYLDTYPEDFPGITEDMPILTINGVPIVDSYLGFVNPNSESIFEPSPLNRVLEQGAPGKAWIANPNIDTDHTIKLSRDTNIRNEVIRFSVTFENNDTEKPQLIKGSTNYAANELYITITKDENWQPEQRYPDDHTTKEYKDKLGRVLLKTTYNQGVAHHTYYVYDRFNNLAFVLPPKVTTDDGVSASELSELCYQYRYDDRNRLIEKKIPGKGWEYIIYNKLDQPILTQDANLRAKNRWLFTKYDALGRVAYTGLAETGSTIALLRNKASSAIYPAYETKSTAPNIIAGTTIYYTQNAYPVRMYRILSINYYDDYTFDTAGITNPGTSFTEPISSNTKSLPTGSKVRVLNTNDWITTVNYYDKKGRSIYVASKNEYLNTTDTIETELDFAGKVQHTKTVHVKDSNAPIITVVGYTYDHMGRLLKQTQKINEEDKELITDNHYNALGQLAQKNIGGKFTGINIIPNPLQKVKYKYNIRGWLQGINDVDNLGNDLFSFKIHYNTVQYGALFNGNIAKTEWKTGNDAEDIKHFYTYGYDALNRIVGATNDNRNNLNNVFYDKNGNITFLHRADSDGSTWLRSLDYLNYTYDAGNKLLKVSETGNKAHGFKDGDNTDNDYTYDANGNMTQDLNKGITGITYNHLNLPETVTINNAGHTGTISYIYDATGAKQRKIATEGSSLTTDYAGNYVYKNGVLEFFNQPEGIVEHEADGYKYIYQYKDHLGNIRLSYSDKNKDGSISQDEIIQENNFYPFGLQHEGYNRNFRGRDHNYKYNGKEFSKELGLNLYEYGSRFYDPAISQFTTIDPKASLFGSQGVYIYAANNPVLFEEKDGESPQCCGEGVGYRFDRRNIALLKGQITEKQFIAEYEAEGKGAIAGVSLLIPGPEDFVIGAFVATKFGGAAIRGLLKYADEAAGAIERGLTKLFSKGGDEAVDVTTATKKVPNPNGKKGGEAHQNTMKEVESDLKAEGFDKIDNEVMVKTPDGEKSKRFIDVQGTNTKTGDVKQVQVGKQNKNGTPIARERRAINDVQDVTKKKVEFRPYNKHKNN